MQKGTTENSKSVQGRKNFKNLFASDRVKSL